MPKADGGAAAIGVLTEQRRFNVVCTTLRAVRGAVDTLILRKDFVVRDCQPLEVRAGGADLALLIVASLPGGQLRRLHDFANWV